MIFLSNIIIQMQMQKNTKLVTLKKPNCGEVDTVARAVAKSISFLISSLLLDKILVGKKQFIYHRNGQRKCSGIFFPDFCCLCWSCVAKCLSVSWQISNIMLPFRFSLKNCLFYLKPWKTSGHLTLCPPVILIWNTVAVDTEVGEGSKRVHLGHRWPGWWWSGVL